MVFDDLYDCLALEHNFHLVMKHTDVLWKGWVQALRPQGHLIPRLIIEIHNGKLRDQLNARRKMIIDLQDIRVLLKNIRRLEALDGSSKNRLEHKYTFKPRSPKAMLEKIKAMSKNQKIGVAEEMAKRYPDMPINKYLKDTSNE